jgi:hypothetical protein
MHSKLVWQQIMAHYCHQRILMLVSHHERALMADDPILLLSIREVAALGRLNNRLVKLRRMDLFLN